MIISALYPLIFIFTFVFGLLIGSFLNCVIYRLAASERRASPVGRETGQSFLKGRSFCPHCKTTLRWFDLIPVLSFFWLKGKCRYCGAKISWQYPLVEIATALFFVQIFNLQLPDVGEVSIFRIVNLFYYLIIICFLVIIFIYDLKHYIIPDKIIYPAIAIAGIFKFFLSNEFSIFQFSIFSAFGAALFFLTVVLITRGKGMGIGDIKLAFLMGLVLGWPNIIVALFLAFTLGASVGVILILLKKKTMKSEVPFGPFLIIGLLLALFFGERIVNWYLSFFLLR